MNALINILRHEVALTGVMPFIRFMELALYHPQHGYYERDPAAIGKAGDFFTNVSVGPVFGELLARQFHTWLRQTPHPVILETGAHDGRLASDILSVWHRLRLPALEYWIVEPSLKRQSWQKVLLRDFHPQVRWFSDASLLDQPCIHGIVLANELLDALPRHRLGWDAQARRWFEWGVQWQADRFVWVRMPWEGPQAMTAPHESGGEPKPATRPQPCFLRLPEGLTDLLPDGFTTEFCPAAEPWWSSLAGLLAEGCLLAVDYGFETEDFFQPHRGEGTLRSYRQHRLVKDVLANPGEQDITGMVDFSALRAAGEMAGLNTLFYGPQSRFLTRVFQAISPAGVSAWSPPQIRQFQTLIHPEHLGGAFRVLVQTKNLHPGYDCF